MKICSICGEEKEISFFPKNQNSKGETIYRSQCKKCWNKRLIAYREKNKDRIKAAAKRTYLKHHESRLERNKAYRDKNKDIISKKARELYASDENVRNDQKKRRIEYRKNNTEKMRTTQLRWNRNNAERRALKNIEWVKNNKSKVDLYLKTWKERHPKRRIAQNIFNNAIRKDPSLRKQKCQICGTSERKLQAHHSDYDKPMDVIWCCKRCHVNLDKMRKQSDIIEQPC